MYIGYLFRGSDDKIGVGNIFILLLQNPFMNSQSTEIYFALIIFIMKSIIKM